MASCFLCGREMVLRFRARDHLRPHILAEYPLEWCGSCQFGKVAGAFSPGDVSKFYASDYYTHVAPGESGTKPTSLSDRLRVHLAWRTDRGVDLSPAEVERPRPMPTLCDIGCGSGQAMAAFKQAGYDAIGVEPDPAARALASKVGQVFEGTAESLPAAMVGREFDVVLLSHVLEHCIDPGEALGNVKGLLAPQGTAIIEVPNNAAAGFEMYGPGWFFADIPRHLQFFTEGSLRKALASVGLRVTRVFYTGYTRQFFPEWLEVQKTIRGRTGMANSRAWEGSIGRLLAATAFARPAKKYDSIRIHAAHQG